MVLGHLDIECSFVGVTVDRHCPEFRDVMAAQGKP
jgi:hypothetical protein